MIRTRPHHWTRLVLVCCKMSRKQLRGFPHVLVWRFTSVKGYFGNSEPDIIVAKTYLLKTFRLSIKCRSPPPLLKMSRNYLFDINMHHCQDVNDVVVVFLAGVKNSSTSLKLSQKEKIDFDLGFAISSFSTRLRWILKAPASIIFTNQLVSWSNNQALVSLSSPSVDWHYHCSCNTAVLHRNREI